MVYYLDASAWVKRYVQEPGTNVVDGLFESPLACSTLGVVGVISILARKHAAGYISADVLEERIKAIEIDWRYFIQIPLIDGVAERAKSLAQSFALRGADAVHLGSTLYLQQELAEDGEQVILVTADRELIAAANSSGFTTLDPTRDATGQRQ